MTRGGESGNTASICFITLVRITCISVCISSSCAGKAATKSSATARFRFLDVRLGTLRGDHTAWHSVLFDLYARACLYVRASSKTVKNCCGLSVFVGREIITVSSTDVLLGYSLGGII